MSRSAQLELTLPNVLKVVTFDLVNEVLIEFDRKSKRWRKLPDVLVVFLVIALGLYRKVGIGDVLERVAGALGDKFGWGLAEVPHATSIARARDRIGWEVFRELFRRVAAALNQRHSDPGVFGRYSAVLALDGSTARTPDTPENARWFGRPARKGQAPSAFSQLRLVVVFDVFSRLPVDAALGPYTWSEVRIAEHLLERVKRGTLLLLDRAYHSFYWPARLDARDVLFLIRSKLGPNVLKMKKGKRLGRDDRLCTLLKSRSAKKRFPDLPDKLLVRVITVRRKGFRPVVLLTNLLSKTEHPAKKLAALYGLRWGAEEGYREIKAQLIDEHVTFRSRRPERVLQEAYGLLIAYSCARALMCEAAEKRDLSPLRLSFTKSLDRIRRDFECAAGCFCAKVDVVHAISFCVLQPKRVGRTCPREVKPRPSKYAPKRCGVPTATGRYGWRAKVRTEAALRNKVAS